MGVGDDDRDFEVYLLFICLCNSKCRGNIWLISVCDLNINLFPSLPKTSINILQKGGDFGIYFLCFIPFTYIVMMISKQLPIQSQLNIWKLACSFQTCSWILCGRIWVKKIQYCLGKRCKEGIGISGLSPKMESGGIINPSTNTASAAQGVSF